MAWSRFIHAVQHDHAKVDKVHVGETCLIQWLSVSAIYFVQSDAITIQAGELNFELQDIAAQSQK